MKWSFERATERERKGSQEQVYKFWEWTNSYYCGSDVKVVAVEEATYNMHVTQLASIEM